MDLKHSQQTLSQAVDPFVEPEAFTEACQIINDSETMPAGERLLVYRHSITGAQQRVLQMVYPVCQKILGDACFDTLARDYAWSPQANCDDLNLYGESFADTLEEQIQQHPTLNELPYLPDLARLEWAWHQSLFTADDTVFDPGSLQGLVTQYGEQLTPELSHSLFPFSSPWPVYEIWQSHKQDNQMQHFSMPDNTQYYVIYRQDEVMIDKVSAVTAQFLHLAQNGLALSSIADRLGNRAELALQQLPAMLEKGWICGFHPPGQEP